MTKMKFAGSRGARFLKRSSSRALIVAGIVLMVALYYDHYYSKTFFKLPANAKITKTVSEKGTLVFSTGVKLELENNYQSNEVVKNAGSIIEISGTVEGEFDPSLKPLMKSNDYSAKINISKSEQQCEDKFVIQYPSFLRRFIYFMPSSPVFSGQVWQITSCNGKFVCNYLILPDKDKRTVEMLCSGHIGDAEVAMAGDLKINKNFDGFSLILLDIVSESPEMVSTWKFSENSKPE